MTSQPVHNINENNQALTFDQEVKKGERFQFGKNWDIFLSTLNPERIIQAEQSLKSMLEVETLSGKTFIDVGSGSGLFSLAARRLGAKVYSFDYDPDSVACTRTLRDRYFPEDSQWNVEMGSVLDKEYINQLGQFDIVYSWGVLHHTGAMYQALNLVTGLVKPGGKLFIGIYNDQGAMSRVWKWVKKTYNQSPAWGKPLILFLASLRLWGPTLLKDLFRFKPFENWRIYSKNRGMSPWRDVVDWVGGYPFEVAKPEEIFNFYHQLGFSLSRLITMGGGLGVNQYVFNAPKKRK
jgi:2-polyprenyl-6-hydroxyphenyl methylase/3-demethylubiquinone-9 3-methyltransferase